MPNSKRSVSPEPKRAKARSAAPEGRGKRESGRAEYRERPRPSRRIP